MRVIFAGTPSFGLACFEALAESEHELLAVYTQPDKPSGRGRKLQASPVKLWAESKGLKIYQPLNFKEPETLATCRALKPDLILVIAYGLLLPKALLDIPTLGCINVHASLLPRWRGASPIQQAILAGDEETGISIMRMDEGLDTGPVLALKACPIEASETAQSLGDKLAKLAVSPLLSSLDLLAKGKADFQVQDSSHATYAGKITKEAARIDWSHSAVEIERLIRAFNPWPIAYTYLGEERLRIHRAKILAVESKDEPGTILALSKQGVEVATGAFILSIQSLQFSGGKVISVVDYMNASSHSLKPGLVLR